MPVPLRNGVGGRGSGRRSGVTAHIGLDHLPHVSVFVTGRATDTFAELGPAAA